MVDLHSHILPGVDDGARTLDESVEIARAAVADGIEIIAATPPVRDHHPTTSGSMERLVAELRSALAAAAVPLDVRPGGELALDHVRPLSIEELRRFALAGNPGYLLVEMPFYGWPLDFGDELFRLQAAGITPVLGHPERNSDVQADPVRLRRLVEAGALVQLTAASLDGRLGRRARETAFRLVKLELAHMVASDAHTAAIREIGMAAAVSAIGDDALARWLARDVPAAIVAGSPLPARPQAPRRRWFVFR